jgi:hypothetical protein
MNWKMKRKGEKPGATTVNQKKMGRGADAGVLRRAMIRIACGAVAISKVDPVAKFSPNEMLELTPASKVGGKV